MTTRSPGRHVANADEPLDTILGQIRRLGENDWERLWDALADQWHEEISRAFTCRLPPSRGPDCETAEPAAASRRIIEEGGNKTGELLRQEEPSACAMSSDPDVRGGSVQPTNGPFDERTCAIGSLEWAEQQRRRENSP